MRIFVTDGANRATLAVTRSLGRAGHQIFVGDWRTGSLAQASRYCTERVLYPDPVTESDAFLDVAVRFVHERRMDVVLPVADITTFLITRNRERFGPSCAVPFADADIVERAANKVDLIHTAERLGIPVPRSVVIASADAIPAELEFPLVIKPRQSRVRTADGWQSSSVSHARDMDELVRDLSSRPEHEFPLMLQERIVGPGIGVFACYQAGRLVALFSHHRLRERPPWGGVSVLAESVPVPPLAGQYATRLLDELRWQGSAMVEFQQDDRDGMPKLMEINGRFWGSLQLAVDSGVDFPALLVQTTGSTPIPPQPPYRIGVRTRWLWGDFDSLLLTLAGSGPSDQTRSRATAVASFLQFFGRNLHYDNPKWDDFRPWWFECGQRARAIIAFLTSNAKTSPVPSPVNASVASEARIPKERDDLRTTIAGSLSALGIDADAWNALASRSHTNTVFQTHEWADSWLTVFGDLYEPLLVAASDASGLVGIAPLAVSRKASRHRVIRFIGDGRSDYCDILAVREKSAALAAMLDTVFTGSQWDVIVLNNVPARSESVSAVRAIAEHSGFNVLVEDQFVCPALLIEGHEEEARKVFNKASLRRRQNFFEREGRLVNRTLSSLADVEPYLDAFFEQHIARWGTQAQSLFLDPRNRTFYRVLAANLARAGSLMFSVIEFNGQPIAFHYGFDYNGCITWYKPSFNVEFASRSPGSVLVRHLIGVALDRGRRELDFTVGDERFKRRFTNTVRKTVSIRIFRDPIDFHVQRSKRAIVAALRRLYRSERSDGGSGPASEDWTV